MIAQIDGNCFKNMMLSAAHNIENHKQEVNELNVFPVPDGDTGTNMSLTMGSLERELADYDDGSIEAMSNRVAGALLRGARGNSGVILSLIFRGFAKGMKGIATAGPQELAAGLAAGVEAAYKAVMKPTEGTILTVARLSAQSGVEEAGKYEDVAGLLERIVKEAKEVLNTTPELLPVLKQAGVVDAGGKGLVYIYEGALHYLMTGELIQADIAAQAAGKADFAALDEEITFGYCTEFIASRQSEKDPQELKAFLGERGDSIVLVDDDEIIKVHVHTDHPGEVLEQALGYGPLLSVKVENMREQHSELKNGAQKEIPSVPAEKDFGFVAVAAGEGLSAVFKDLGVDQMVKGGQTMNPSTEDILTAVKKTPARTVFVLPNNKNIILAAEQAAPLSKDKKIIVIPSKTVPQGVSAMLAFDEGMSEKENAAAMEEAIGQVKTAQVTYAARNSVFDGKKIKEGQLLGFIEGKLEVSGKKMENTVLELIERMLDDNSEILTLYCGQEVSKADREKLEKKIGDKYGDRLECTFIDGGQPVYYYTISME